MSINEHFPDAPRKLINAEKALRSGNFRLADEHYSKILDGPEAKQLDKEMLATCFLNRGFARRRLGRLQRALDDAEQAAVHNPRSFKPHMNAALIYAQDLHRYEEALEEFDEAIRLNPTNIEGLSSRGLTKLLVGDEIGAEKDLKAALAIKPDDPDALCNLGNLHLKCGNDSSAAECYQKALESAPKDSEIRVNLAMALARLGASDAAASVLRKDRRAIELWKSKGGFQVRPAGAMWRLTAFIIIIVILIIFMVMMVLQVDV